MSSGKPECFAASLEAMPVAPSLGSSSEAMGGASPSNKTTGPTIHGLGVACRALDSRLLYCASLYAAMVN